MPAVAQDETINCANPTLFFAFQRDGKLIDIFSLKRSVFEIPPAGAAIEKIPEATLDLSPDPVGVRIALGVYHANFAATGFRAGTHEIRWKYKETSTSTEFEFRQRFEVVDKNKFSRGAAYVGYLDSVTLKTNALFTEQSVGAIQEFVDRASRKVELLTGRFFEPRYRLFKLDGRGNRRLMPQHPIVGINKVEIETGVTGIEASLTEVSLDGLRVYNRHLGGLLDPDDRDDPRIEIERFEGILFQSTEFFPLSSQGIFVTGVWGYTDPDGGPLGKTPTDITTAVGAFATRNLQDPFGQDPFITAPSSVRSAKTRDQAISFGRTGGGGIGGRGSFGGLTGDDFIDQLLIPYVRPPHYGAV